MITGSYNPISGVNPYNAGPLSTVYGPYLNTTVAYVNTPSYVPQTQSQMQMRQQAQQDQFISSANNQKISFWQRLKILFFGNI